MDRVTEYASIVYNHELTPKIVALAVTTLTLLLIICLAFKAVGFEKRAIRRARGEQEGLVGGAGQAAEYSFQPLLFADPYGAGRPLLPAGLARLQLDPELLRWWRTCRSMLAGSPTVPGGRTGRLPATAPCMRVSKAGAADLEELADDEADPETYNDTGHDGLPYCARELCNQPSKQEDGYCIYHRCWEARIAEAGHALGALA